MLIVSNNDECLPQLTTQVEEELVQLLLIVRIKASRRFISQNHLGAIDESTGYGNTLFLTTRQLRRLVCGTISKMQVIEHLHSSDASIVHANPSDESGHHHILHGGKFGQKLMKLEYESNVTVTESRKLTFLIGRHIDAIKKHTSAIGAIKSAEDLQQRRLTGSTGAYDADHLPLINGKVYAFEHFKLAKTLMYVV